MDGDLIADLQGANIVAEHRRALVDDVPVVSAACATLGITTAAFANEGLAVHVPEPSALVAALQSARNAPSHEPGLGHWTVLTNRQSTHAILETAGCTSLLVSRGDDYLGSFPDEH